MALIFQDLRLIGFNGALSHYGFEFFAEFPHCY